MTTHTAIIRYQSPATQPEPRRDLLTVLAAPRVSLALMCAIAFGIGFMIAAVGMA